MDENAQDQREPQRSFVYLINAKVNAHWDACPYFADYQGIIVKLNQSCFPFETSILDWILLESGSRVIHHFNIQLESLGTTLMHTSYAVFVIVFCCEQWQFSPQCSAGPGSDIRAVEASPFSSLLISSK